MKVLLVDDDEAIRKIGKLSLERIGNFEVWVAASVEDALASAREHRPDLILLDMMMPDVDGLQAIAMLKADPKLRDISVIFITARVQHYEINEYTEAGALGTIQKPFDPLKLPQAILDIFNKPNKAETNDTQSKETI
jgi:two-component system OmpR family response regulator